MSFISKESYDSDAIREDIDDFDDNNCNLLVNTNNTKYIESIKQFIKNDDILSNSFSTGICFWYHPYYKNIDEQKYKKDAAIQDIYGYNIYNMNDFSGHSICDLFVCKYFDSIKEEVLNSKYINIAEWNQFVINKANHYINTGKM